MRTIIISPWSRKTPKGEHCAKNYPFWPEVVNLLHEKQYNTIQIGVQGEELIGCKETFLSHSLSDLKNLLLKHRLWISVDNFFGHFANFYKVPGVVIFSKSNPKIFGYQSNINLLKNESFIRRDQFLFWDNEKVVPESFVSPQEVINAIILCDSQLNKV